MEIFLLIVFTSIFPYYRKKKKCSFVKEKHTTNIYFLEKDDSPYVPQSQREDDILKLR